MGQIYTNGQKENNIYTKFAIHEMVGESCNASYVSVLDVIVSSR